MSIGLYATRISAEVLTKGESSSMSYREFPDVNYYWCMVDLVQSSNYRLVEGPERGYLRGESFFTLVRSATRPYVDLRAFKEIGDAVLLCSDGFRPMFEACVLMAVAARHLAHVAASPVYPFAIRLGIDFGLGKKLDRPQEDYLGESIDRLARLMSVRSATSNFLIGEPAYTTNRRILMEYESFCEFSKPLRLDLPAGKQLSELVVYREVRIRHEDATEFADFFTEWRKASGQRR